MFKAIYLTSLVDTHNQDAEDHESERLMHINIFINVAM
jgi:hypothetical protein